MPKITRTEIFRLSLPMEPFVIATEVSTEAKNVFIRIHTDDGLTGMGECSAFPMLVGETQSTCFEVAKDFARIIKGKEALDIETRLRELDEYIAFNTTIKSAFDMALLDLAAKAQQIPLYRLLGGRKKPIRTDLTIGIDTPQQMAKKAAEYVKNGVAIIKIKLGKKAADDIERVKLIREAAGQNTILRLDANQGWDYDTALECLIAMEGYEIEFCEQPIHHHYDYLLPLLRKESPVPVMADESVFNHHDAIRLIESDACDYINIKLAKSGGIREAIRVADTAASYGVACMLGGMLESRLALTAKVHLAMSHDNIIFYDLDTCLLGQLVDPVIGGAKYNNYFLEVTDEPGIAADIDPEFLKGCEKTEI